MSYYNSDQLIRLENQKQMLLEALELARKHVWAASYDNLQAQNELIKIDAAIAATKGE